MSGADISCAVIPKLSKEVWDIFIKPVQKRYQTGQEATGEASEGDAGASLDDIENDSILSVRPIESALH
jgi:hypothetical protein